MSEDVEEMVTAGLQEIKGFLFDIDGVLLLGNTAIPGAREVLDELRGKGKQVVFVSNTSSRSREQCLQEFAESGISVASEEFFLASEETSRYLAEKKPKARVFLIGAPGLYEELHQKNLCIYQDENVDPRIIDFVVVGRDRTVNYQKLKIALQAITEGALFVAVNNDPTIPTRSGLEPGAGAIVAAISTMVGRVPDISFGKPSTLLLELALQHTSLGVEDCVMIGDSIGIDIVAGNRLGMTTILVLSGNTSKEDLSANCKRGEECPDLVLPSVRELIDLLK